MSRKKPENISFAEAMKSIEEILEQLESHDISLEDSLTAFETGVSLVRQAQDTLAQAQQKVLMLLEREGEIQVDSIELDEDAE